MQFTIENYNSEKYVGIGIVVCFIILLISVLCINFFNVKIKNLEQVDGDLYTVVTDKGIVNISKQDILRIDKTSTKSPISGKQIEIDKIYTKQGFIYLSSVDQFSKTGKELINSFNSQQSNIWKIPDYSEMSSFKSYIFAIGTPKKIIPFLSFLLALEYILLITIAVSILWLIFPCRFPKQLEHVNEYEELIETESFKSEDKLGMLAK